MEIAFCGKSECFQLNISIHFTVTFIFAKNIGCWYMYMLEPLRRGGSNAYPQYFEQELLNNNTYNKLEIVFTAV